MKTLRFLLLCVSLAACGAAQATVRISIDLSTQRLTAARGGETVVWKISSGRPGYETPSGRYSVMRMEAEHFSDEYEQAPMPYAIFFSPRGFAIHGTSERGLGRPASHGCVRLSVVNAQKLFAWVEEQGATIDIVGETPPVAERSPRAERGRAARRARGVQDPSDFVLEQAYR
jgi:hypothetical protein